jgi:hypothetical protein
MVLLQMFYYKCSRYATSSSTIDPKLILFLWLFVTGLAFYDETVLFAPHES